MAFRAEYRSAKGIAGQPGLGFRVKPGYEPQPPTQACRTTAPLVPCWWARADLHSFTTRLYQDYMGVYQDIINGVLDTPGLVWGSTCTGPVR